jgi:RNA polymerase sigma factor (sigma-70 family)
MNPVTQIGPEGHQVEGPTERAGRITLLVQAAARGNQSAWEGLVNEFSPVVLGVARSHRLSEADVADVAQTTWLRLVENLPRIMDPERVGAWLATTATRESARVAQKARKQIVTDELPERGADDDVAQRVVNAERQTALRSAFRRLRRRDQALLGLLVADPAPSYEQIGRILHMPVGSIGPTRARSLTRLRREAALFGIEELTPSTRRM